MCAVELSSGQLASCVLHHWPSRDLKGLQDHPSCLAELLENWKRLTRMKWAWHLVTSTFILRGKRGTWRHQPSFCGAGVALGDINLRFAGQARHLVTSTRTHKLPHRPLSHTPFTHNLENTSLVHTVLSHTTLYTPSLLQTTLSGTTLSHTNLNTLEHSAEYPALNLFSS